MSDKNESFPVQKSEEEWRKELGPEQYQVLRKHATERAGTSPLNYEKRKGEFRCAGCGAPLFDSSTKYESGSGWPSFWAPKDDHAVETTTDRSHGMTRVEVHLRQVRRSFGPCLPGRPAADQGQRYCMNGAALKFDEKK